MKIKTRCGHCGKVYQMDDNFLGQIAQCRNCQKYFTMTPFEDQPGAEPAKTPGQAPPGRSQPTPKKSKKGCFFKLLAFLLLFTLLAAGALTAGLKFFPDVFKKLGFSNLVALLPF